MANTVTPSVAETVKVLEPLGIQDAELTFRVVKELPDDAKVLVVGGGGGKSGRNFRDRQPHRCFWRRRDFYGQVEGEDPPRFTTAAAAVGIRLIGDGAIVSGSWMVFDSPPPKAVMYRVPVCAGTRHASTEPSPVAKPCPAPALKRVTPGTSSAAV